MRHAHIEESIDKKAYDEKKNRELLSSKMPVIGSDLGQLISTLGAMMQMMNLSQNGGQVVPNQGYRGGYNKNF